MNKYTFRLLAIVGVLGIVLASGLVSYARLNNPADPALVQTPWVGNVDGGGFNLSNVGTLGVTTLTAGTLTVSNLVTSPLLIGGSASTTLTGDGSLSTIGGALNINGDVAFISGVSVTQTPSAISVSTSTTSIDIGTSNKFHITMATDTTIEFVDPAGASNLTLKLIQDATGTRLITWPGTVKWPSGSAPTLTTTGNAIDFVSCYHDGTNYYCTDSLDFQ